MGWEALGEWFVLIWRVILHLALLGPARPLASARYLLSTTRYISLSVEWVCGTRDAMGGLESASGIHLLPAGLILGEASSAAAVHTTRATRHQTTHACVEKAF